MRKKDNQLPLTIQKATASKKQLISIDQFSNVVKVQKYLSDSIIPIQFHRPISKMFTINARQEKKN